MGFFDGMRKKGRPRQNFTVEESREIILATLGRMIHSEIDWSTHKKVSGNVFTVSVTFLSLYSLEMVLKHKNVKDVYFNPQPLNTGRMMLKLVYR